MRRFRVNEPNVVFEAFDEEIVAVNLDTGNYYSISGSGPKIWMDIIGGLTSEEVVDRLQACYVGADDSMPSQVAAFVNRLIAEKLIVEASESPDRQTVVQPVPPERTPFQAPVMDNYADMQDLLMLDPIHDVDPAGWPVAKTNP